jgi:error-prone DNA polymerase
MTGPLLQPVADRHEAAISPLFRMTDEERLVADFSGTGMTVGPHPMSYHRAEMDRMGVARAADLHTLPSGRFTRIAGSVIARQRPGTAKGFVFLSIEDETGISNAIILPAIYEKFRTLVMYGKFLMVEGQLQNQDNVISVKAATVKALQVSEAHAPSHDFH